MKDYSLTDLFSFEARDVVNHMFRELKLGNKFKNSFKYIIGKLPVQKLKKLEKLKWDEGKNYDWAVVKDGKVTLMIRGFRSHFTVFYNIENEPKYFSKYGSFTFFTNTDNMTDKDHDLRGDDKFYDFDKYIKQIIKMLDDDQAHMLWNSATLPRPNFIEIKNIWNGGEDLEKIDLFLFCCDELFEKYLELFSKNEMLEKIKTLKVGDILNDIYTVVEVRTDVEDDYYHNAGLTLLAEKRGKKDWHDVFSLTRWYLKDVFPEIH